MCFLPPRKCLGSPGEGSGGTRPHSRDESCVPAKTTDSYVAELFCYSTKPKWSAY